MTHLLLTAAAAIIYVLGGVFMAQKGLSNLLLVYGCFIIGATFQTLATRHISNMSMTYLVTLGLEAVLTMGFGVALLQERFNGSRLVGAVLVIAGIAVLRFQGR